MGDLLERYGKCFDLYEATFSRIDHNDAMVAIVYRVDLPSEKSLILKICTRDKAFHRELYFLNALAGYLPVPKVLMVAEPVVVNGTWNDKDKEIYQYNSQFLDSFL